MDLLERYIEVRIELRDLKIKLTVLESANAELIGVRQNLQAELHEKTLRIQFLDNVVTEMSELNKRRVVRKLAARQ